MNPPSPGSDPPPELLLETERFNVVRKHRVDERGQAYSRAIVEHPGAVVLLPVLNDGRICLIRNYRIAVEAQLIELPAGTLETGEDPAVTAARELTEETVYRAAELIGLTSFWMSPGILNERMHLFVARQLTPGESELQAGEEIETLLATWNEVQALIHGGQIAGAKSLAALLFVGQFHPHLLQPGS